MTVARFVVHVYKAEGDELLGKMAFVKTDKPCDVARFVRTVWDNNGTNLRYRIYSYNREGRVEEVVYAETYTMVSFYVERVFAYWHTR